MTVIFFAHCRTNSALRCHAVTHTGLRPYQCRTCQMTFTNLSNLSKHRRCHDTTMPHICKVCGARFAYRWSWQQHEKGHLGLKPYLCNVCGKSFTQACTLRGHQKTHEREDEDSATELLTASRQQPDDKRPIHRHRKSSARKKSAVTKICSQETVSAENALAERRTDCSSFSDISVDPLTIPTQMERDNQLSSGLPYPYNMMSNAVPTGLPPIEYAGIITHSLPSHVSSFTSPTVYQHASQPEENSFSHYTPNNRFSNTYM